MKGSPYARPPFPSTWARMSGKGRVFYSILGHDAEAWDNPVLQRMYFNAIREDGGVVDSGIIERRKPIDAKTQTQAAPAQKGQSMSRP